MFEHTQVELLAEAKSTDEMDTEMADTHADSIANMRHNLRVWQGKIVFNQARLRTM